MKKLTSLLIGCLLALAGAALAQQPVEQQSPSKGKRPPEKTHAAPQAQPGANAVKPAERPAKQTGAMKEHGTMNQPGTMKEHGATTQHGATNEPGAMKEHGATNEPPRTNVSGEQVGGQTPNARQRIEERRKGMKGPAAPAKTSTNPAAPPAAAAGGAPSGPAAGQQNMQANAGAKAKKPEPQQVPPVTYNQNYRIQGSEQWQGSRYEVFRSYHPEWHDEGWYHSHYSQV